MSNRREPKVRGRTLRLDIRDEECNETVEEHPERDTWPRAAWSRAVASNA